MPTKLFKSNASLGKTLMNKQSQARKPKIQAAEGFKQHTTELIDIKHKTDLKSILEQNSLEEFMQMADMSQKKFEAERRGATAIDGVTVIPDISKQDSFNQ
jgi:hypothetical protein